MLKMPQINHIKDLSKSGYRIGEISKFLGIDRKTVRKYLNMEDFSPKVPVVTRKPSILDPYKETILQWLQEDQQRWYKQQHTAKRIWDRLKEEKGFQGGYNTVQRFIKKVRHLQQQVGTQELVWKAGSAQVDFGEADFDIRGIVQRMKYLVVSFPQSNDSFAQVFGGETSECVCQGLKNIFEYIGGVPQLTVFDNATGVGHRKGNDVYETELFQRFRAHYGFRVRFCNPHAGYEKGNVERKVGYTRANLFVPMPKIQDLAAYNRILLDQHRQKANELHYKKGVSIAELFEADRKALLPLPRVPFHVCRYDYVKADGYGKICLDGKHYYATCPENSHQKVLVGIYADRIDILYSDGSRMTSYVRHFGPQRTDCSDYRTLLSTLMDKPGAWENSPFREQVPDILRQYIDQQDRKGRKTNLHLLHELAEQYDMETAFMAMEQSIHGGKINRCDATVLAQRMATYGLNQAPSPGPSLDVYDEAFLKGGVIH